MPFFKCARRMLPWTVCLIFHEFLALRYAWWALRDTRAAHSRFVLAAAAPPYSMFMFHPIANARTPNRITYADCPNECLYQFGSRSVQPFGRQCWICSLSVYARVCTQTCARVRGRTCAQHTHMHTHAHTHTHTVLSRYSPQSARCERAN
jgi:hypothetical protein